MRLVCPACGMDLAPAGGSVYVCGNGHAYEALYQTDQGFCLPIIGCFSGEVKECKILGFSLGNMPEYACSGIRLVLLGVGIFAGVKLVKALLGGFGGKPKTVIYEYD